MRNCDGCLWRVTVHLDEKENIRDILQEIELGLPKNVPHGSGMRDALKYGINSPQMDWHRIPTRLTCYDESGSYKYDLEGNRHDFPEP